MTLQTGVHLEREGTSIALEEQLVEYEKTSCCVAVHVAQFGYTVG